MNIDVHLLDRKVRNATTHRGEGEFNAIRGVVLIQGSLWIGMTTNDEVKSWCVIGSGT